MASFTAQLVDSIVSMPEKFADVATHDPLSAVLMLFGALFVFGAVGAFGYLSLGALADLLTPASATEPRREAR